MDTANPSEADLLPTLTPEQVARLEAYGSREPMEAGTVLFDEGAKGIDFFVVLSGRVEIRQYAGDGFRSIVKEETGQFVGDTSTLNGHAAVIQARVEVEGEVLRIPAAALKRVVVEDSELSDLILRTFLLRRGFMVEGNHSATKLIGSRFSRETHALREFLTRNNQPYTFLDLEKDPGVAELLEQFHIRPDETPILVRRDRDVYKNPTAETVAHCLGLDTLDTVDTCDVVVVGSGPAGLATSVYAASEGLSVMCLDTSAPGGQAGTSSKIENYLGFPTGISGRDLADRATLQAQKFGASLANPVRAVKLKADGATFRVEFADGRSARGRSVVIATGARYRTLGLPEAQRFEGSGIYYGATAMESDLCNGRDVVVVGGGNSAGQGAVYLARCARSVHVVIRRDDLDATMSRYLIRRITETPNIHLHPRTEVTALDGNACLEHVELTTRGNESPHRLECGHLFLFLGALPCTEWLRDTIDLDDKGFIRTGPDLDLARDRLDPLAWKASRPPTLFETSLPRVYAVGDARAGSVKRVASAVGEGSIVVQFLHRALAEG